MTKENSKGLYGIAVLLMIYHHLFCIPERLNCSYYSLLGIDMGGGKTLELKIAWFGKICIAIYAFITGYGLFQSVNNKSMDTLTARLVYDYSYIIKKIFLFLTKVIIVFCVFAPIGIGLGKIEFDNFVDLVLSAVGYNIKINSEWWYIKVYVCMLLVFPIGNAFFEHYRKNEILNKLLLLIVGTCAFIVARQYLASVYFVIFCTGYLISKYRVFQKLDLITERKLRIGVICVVTAFVIRIIIADSAIYNDIDILITPLFIYGVCILNDYANLYFKLLKKIGEYSTYIWLTHTFFCYYYFQKIITISRFSTLILMETIVASFFTAVVLSEIEKKVICIVGGYRNGTD